MAYSTPSGEETAPANTGARAGEENSPRRGAVKNLSLRERGPHSESGGRIGAKNYDSGDGGRSTESICSVKEMASTKSGAKTGEENAALDKYLMNKG